MKANQYHRAGNTFRHTNYVKIPIEKRVHNRDKWKRKGEARKSQQKARIEEKKSSWWKKKWLKR